MESFKDEDITKNVNIYKTYSNDMSTFLTEFMADLDACIDKEESYDLFLREYCTNIFIEKHPPNLPDRQAEIDLIFQNRSQINYILNKFNEIVSDFEDFTCENNHKQIITRKFLFLTQHDQPDIRSNSLKSCLILLGFKGVFEEYFLENEMVHVFIELLNENEINSDDFISIVESLALTLTVSSEVCQSILNEFRVETLLGQSLTYYDPLAVGAVGYYAAESTVFGVCSEQADDIIETFEKCIELNFDNSAKDIITRLHFVIESWPEELDFGILHHHGIFGLINRILSETCEIEDVSILVTYALDCLALILQRKYLPQIDFRSILRFPFEENVFQQKSALKVLSSLPFADITAFKELCTKEYFCELFSRIESGSNTGVNGIYSVFVRTYVESLSSDEINVLLADDFGLFEFLEQQLLCNKNVKDVIRTILIFIKSSQVGDLNVQNLIAAKISSFEDWDELDEYTESDDPELVRSAEELTDMINNFREGI